MQQLLTLAAIAFALGDLLFVLLLLGRRAGLAQREQHRLAAEQRLRPLALAITDGDAGLPKAMPHADSVLLASLLARYAQWLTGTSRGAIATWFELHGDVGRAMRGLRHRRHFQRASAAHALGDMGSPAAVELLVASLDDPVRDVRAAAARSLGRIGSPAAVPPLVRALAARAVPRAIGAQALLAIGPDAVPALRELARDDDAALAAIAVELVALIGDAGDARWLHELLTHDAAPLRAAAAFALGRLGDEDDAVALCATLADVDPGVRVASADALRAIGDAATVPALLAAARHRDYGTARAAAGALVRIAPRRLRDEAGRHPDAPHLHEAAAVVALHEAA